MRRQACSLAFILALLWGTVYSCENCLPNPDNTTDTCYVTSGHCLHGCIKGFFGLNCSYDCPKNCIKPSEENETYCDNITGECLNGCIKGHAGPNCSYDCPEKCAPPETNESQICNETSFDCLYGCKDGFYGNQCNKSCSLTDKYCSECYEETGSSGTICTQCYKNFYRLNGKCASCNYWCLPNVTSSVSICREHSGYCEFGCRPGRYGFLCNDRCSDSCMDVCDRQNGKCLTGCKYQIKCGPTCKDSCNVGCLHQLCNQSCACVNGCDKGYWGDRGQYVCPKQCKPSINQTSDRRCDSSNGHCLYGCYGDENWGSGCQYKCSPGCATDKCEQESGACIQGCKTQEVYGPKCNMICNENCLNRTCWRNGSCDQGCVAGSYGALCQLSCNKNCLHETCNRDNGFCSGCSSGWYGNTCSLQCNDVYENGTCEQDSGDCELTITEAKALNQSENEDLFGQNSLYINVAILGSGWMMFLILLIIFIVILCKRRCAAEVVKDKESETTKTEKEIVKMKRRNQGDEYITLQMDSSEVKNSFDNSEYTGLKALEGKSQNQRRGVVSYVNLGLGLKRTG